MSRRTALRPPVLPVLVPLASILAFSSKMEAIPLKRNTTRKNPKTLVGAIWNLHEIFQEIVQDDQRAKDHGIVSTYHEFTEEHIILSGEWQELPKVKAHYTTPKEEKRIVQLYVRKKKETYQNVLPPPHPFTILYAWDPEHSGEHLWEAMSDHELFNDSLTGFRNPKETRFVFRTGSTHNGKKERFNLEFEWRDMAEEVKTAAHGPQYLPDSMPPKPKHHPNLAPHGSQHHQSSVAKGPQHHLR